MRTKKTIVSILSLLFVATQSAVAQNFELLDTKYSSGIESLILGTDKQTLITGHLDGKVCFWDVETFTITKTIQDRMGTVNSILFNPKGDQFVTSGDGATLGVYEYPSGKLLYKLVVPCD